MSDTGWLDSSDSWIEPKFRQPSHRRRADDDEQESVPGDLVLTGGETTFFVAADIELDIAPVRYTWSDDDSVPSAFDDLSTGWSASTDLVVPRVFDEPTSAEPQPLPELTPPRPVQPESAATRPTRAERRRQTQTTGMRRTWMWVGAVAALLVAAVITILAVVTILAMRSPDSETVTAPALPTYGAASEFPATAEPAPAAAAEAGTPAPVQPAPRPLSGAAVQGQVDSNDGSTVMMTTLTGQSVTVVVNESTRVLGPGGSSLSDLDPGDNIVVQGDVADTTVTARAIVVTTIG